MELDRSHFDAAAALLNLKSIVKPLAAKKQIAVRVEQAAPSYARLKQGPGRGLALTGQFVELHGGRLWVESEGEGKVSTFSFVLPAPPGAAVVPQPAAAAPTGRTAELGSD